MKREGLTTVCAQMLRVSGSDDETEWLIKVDYDLEYYLVVMKGDLVTVYNERELPDSPGQTMHRPMNLTSHRSAAIECCRRVKFGEAD